MAKYKAYNQLYKNNKKIGGKYLVMTGINKEELRKKINSYNRRWNSLKENKKQGFKSKLISIK